MKKLFTLSLLILSIQTLWAQYQIGETTITFIDPSRNNRPVETHIYYPANTLGTNVAAANGQFPIVIVGHGFLMNYDVYQYLWEYLVPLGYILALPATETGIGPSHADFGLDLRYTVTALQIEGNTTNSIFYQKTATTAAIMGHSMGGGSSFLAVEHDSIITTMISMAAAETTPSAVSAANSIHIPTLTFSGDEDCVAAAANHQALMYNNLADCKAYATIIGGTHCQFSNNSSVCNLGELTCLFGATTISRADQHSAILTILTPWLDAWLYSDYSRWQTFTGLAGNGTNYNLALVCNSNAPTSLGHVSEKEIRISPNPCQDKIYIQGASQPINYSIYNHLGQCLQQGALNTNVIDIKTLPKGTYFLQLLHSKTGASFTKKILKL